MLTQHQQQHEQHQPPGATADAAAKCFSSAIIVDSTKKLLLVQKGGAVLLTRTSGTYACLTKLSMGFAAIPAPKTCFACKFLTVTGIAGLIQALIQRVMLVLINQLRSLPDQLWDFRLAGWWPVLRESKVATP